MENKNNQKLINHLRLVDVKKSKLLDKMDVEYFMKFGFSFEKLMSSFDVPENLVTYAMCVQADKLKN